MTALKNLDVHESNINFIDIPEKDDEAYEKEIINFIDGYLKNINPHQLFMAGDFKIPYGIEKRYFYHLISSVRQLQKSQSSSQCWIWLHNESNQDWRIFDIDMAVPLSPDQVLKSVIQFLNFFLKRKNIVPRSEYSKILSSIGEPK